MRVILADAHPLFRQGLRDLLEGGSFVEVVGEADNGPDTVTLTEKLVPDAVVIDINMPGYSGLEATKQIKNLFPDIKVIILSNSTDRVYADQALKYGACGYVLKDNVYDELITALGSVKE